MAYIKKGTLYLSSGQQIKLSGSNIGLMHSLEVGEVFPMRIFGISEAIEKDKRAPAIYNPHGLSVAAMHEILDMIMEDCIILKKNLREHGHESIKVFSRP